ncbi:hypothetical protein IFM89_022236 [Coptis chinensis]|uniref:Retrotransposon Copia-like N-terminal domain-containing protein n=1 Tax=Coptis chinensis TaxID=261450 RepID=A0A835HNZ0_9MAGN|nr:hypothetical protein IFM89_022236 [Coptis chinensis]
MAREADTSIPPLAIPLPKSLLRDDDLPKSLTAKKLNDANYLAWCNAVKVCLRGKRKLKYLTDDPPDPQDDKYEDWLCEDSLVMSCLWHSMEPHIATTVEFCESSKSIWNSLSESFSQQNNVSRVFEIYEKIFSMKQSSRPLTEYYSNLKNLWEQLLQYRPFITDLELQKCYWEDFIIASLMNGLDPSFHGFKDQILANDTLPTAANAYS